MAEAGATATGLRELSAAVDRLQADVTVALRAVAWRASRRIMDRAKQILGSKLKTDARALIDAIVVIEEADKRQFVVASQAPSNQPANLPLWIERGTRFMAPRPYMRPAGDAEEARYLSESMDAATAVADKLGSL